MGSRRAIIVILALSAAAGSAAAAWLLDEPAASGLVIDETDAALVGRGQELYAAYCASCHGDRLQGQPDWQRRTSDGLLPAPPHDETGHTWHHPDSVLLELTKYGPSAFEEGYVSAMPAFADILSEGEIVAVLAFIKSTWPEAIRARQAATTRAAREAQ